MMLWFLFFSLADKNLMSLTGKILMTADLARRYGINDVDGNLAFPLFEFLLKFTILLINVFKHCALNSDMLAVCLLPGRSVTDFTSVKYLVSQAPYLSWLSPVVPSFIRVPHFVINLAFSHF